MKIETTLEYVKVKLDDFIAAADHKYATKEEVAQLRKDTDSNTSLIKEIVIRWGPIIIVAGYVLKQSYMG